MLTIIMLNLIPEKGPDRSITFLYLATMVIDKPNLTESILGLSVREHSSGHSLAFSHSA